MKERAGASPGRCPSLQRKTLNRLGARRRQAMRTGIKKAAQDGHDTASRITRRKP
jgi:hypothetical protein